VDTGCCEYVITGVITAAASNVDKNVLFTCISE
jgi:hypothetical protein